MQPACQGLNFDPKSHCFEGRGEVRNRGIDFQLSCAAAVDVVWKGDGGLRVEVPVQHGNKGLGYYKDTYTGPQGVKRRADTQEAASAPPTKKLETLRGGLKCEVVKSGNGPKAIRGKIVQVRYEGRLAKNGKRFDKGTIRFKLGAGEVIQGWDIGVADMLVGEKRKLLIPPAMGYGSQGAPPDIPPNASLTFEVELLRVG